jgi:hypothetical protein
MKFKTYLQVHIGVDILTTMSDMQRDAQKMHEDLQELISNLSDDCSLNTIPSVRRG